jgi:hypothetical protein
MCICASEDYVYTTVERISLLKSEREGKEKSEGKENKRTSKKKKKSFVPDSQPPLSLGDLQT